MSEMIKGLIILLVIIVIQLSCGSVTDTDYQLKHPKHMFILHRCTATAQLNKRNRNEEVPSANLDKPPENLHGKLYDSFKMQERNSNFRARESMPVNSKLNNHSRIDYETRYEDTSIN